MLKIKQRFRIDTFCYRRAPVLLKPFRVIENISSTYQTHCREIKDIVLTSPRRSVQQFTDPRLKLKYYVFFGKKRLHKKNPGNELDFGLDMELDSKLKFASRV